VRAPCRYVHTLSASVFRADACLEALATEAAEVGLGAHPLEAMPAALRGRWLPGPAKVYYEEQ
jgi:hypothetical protein